MNPISRARSAEERASRMASREPAPDVQAERNRMTAEREARIEAERERDRAARVQPVQSAFEQLKAHLGTAFPDIARDLLRVDWVHLRTHVATALAQHDSEQRAAEEAENRAYSVKQVAA